MAGLTDAKTVLVTGAASGIGRAAAERFAAEGAAHVILADTDLDGSLAVAESIEAGGGAASAIRVDVSDEAAVRDAVDELVAEHGRLDIAFNNAGVNDAPTAFHDLELERWERMISVNLTSVFVCMKHELRHMVAQGSGSIVNTSSGAGLVAAPMLPHYTAAKHGVLGLTRAAAAEHVRQGIRVNAVLPGTTDTGMVRSFIADHPEMEQLLRRSNVTGELLRPDEIAATVVWLASDHAQRVNGQSVVVDGGGILH